ncbi:MAG: hypothetical protein L0G94_11605 [Brachybacterium sp.]|uniref:hypothetical protein n=1 Tax=Brachybacterium sp. TaxID=1891286 RepID=UPI0026481F21|nr:hypothetical protein [Brachybacterium sp.]MDN5687302.1 hypothetical protein [Brachybacterium sp.]
MARSRMRASSPAGPRTSRRALFLAVGALAAGAVTSCASREADERLATQERPVASPSGDFSAALVADGVELHPTIRTADGTEVWSDDLGHANRDVPGVAWEQDADVLWVLSADHGNASVRRGEDGTWAKTPGSKDMPKDIAELAR